MAAETAKERYARGLLISRIGSLAGTVGVVTLISVGDQVGGSLIGVVLMIVAMYTVHVGGLIMGEASVFLAEWAKGRDAE